MPNRFNYPVDLSKDETDLRITARVPDLPGCVTDGATREEALIEAADALEETLAHFIVANEPAPPPSPVRGRPTVSPGAIIAAKSALCEAMRDAGSSKSELARRLGVQENEVRRMLDPRHRTKISTLEAALVLLGKRLIITVAAA